MFAASKTGAQVAPASTDPNFEYVSLLLNGDGTNGAQNNTFLDSSSNAFTITRNGSATQGSFSPYGTLWSNYFNGTNAYFTLGGQTNFAFGSGDFTIESWVYQTSSTTYVLYDSRPSSTNGAYILLYGDASGLYLYVNSTTVITSSAALPLNTWTHVALTRSGTSTKLFINGTQSGSTYTDTNSYLNGTARPIIGANGFVLQNYFPGYLSNYRVVKGTAVYTSTFTPSTTPLTAISGTSLLTCQSNRFIDNSSNAFAITVNGSPNVQRFSPFEPSVAYSSATTGGSGYFNGTSDWLSQTSGSIGNFGTGSYTVEFWIYPSSTATLNMVDFRGTGGSGTALRIAFGQSVLGSANKIQAGWTADNQLIQTNTASTNQWYHVAVVKNGTTVTLYINGVSNASITDTTSLVDNGLIVGSYRGTTAYISGYINDLRVVKGSAVYTSNFTPPTAPLTAVSGTSLLLSMANAGISDAAAINDLTTVGSAQVTTTVKKYGSGSMTFNGTTSYLTIPSNQAFVFGTGDFTIECWVNPSFDTTSGTASAALWQIGKCLASWDNLKKSWNFAIAGGAYTVRPTGGISTGNWYHVAYVRSGTTATVYYNGTSVATAADANNYVDNGLSYIGNRSSLAEYLNGYVDDFRVTKGVARYTANFTPPTAALPLY